MGHSFHLVNALAGFIVLIGNTLWLLRIIYTYYEYHFTDCLFLVMIPDWILILNSFFASSGIYLGVLIIKKRVNPIKWFLIDLGFTLFVISMEVFYVE